MKSDIYFSVIYCLSSFWFNVSFFKSDHRRMILFCRKLQNGFCFMKYDNDVCRVGITVLALKGLFPRPGMFNNMSRVLSFNSGSC
jgi:hypothetical protein